MNQQTRDVEKSQCCGSEVYYQVVKPKRRKEVRIPRCYKCLMVCIVIENNNNAYIRNSKIS